MAGWSLREFTCSMLAGTLDGGEIEMDADMNDAFHWAFGRGFWYADPVAEMKSLSEEQLYWSPAPDIQCVLWHVGHIGHREDFHIQCLLKGRDEKEVFPDKWGIFSDCPYEAVPFRNTFPEPGEITNWMRSVRARSHEFISGLKSTDYNSVPRSSFEGGSIARVLMQTVGHTALHIGRIQLLRRLMRNEDVERAHGFDQR
jgi:hypothetical protein